MTAESLRAEADALEAEAKRLLDDAERRRQLAAQIEQLDSGLSSGTDNVTIAPVTQPQSVRYVKKNLHRGPVLRSKGPVASVARRLRMSMRQVASEIGVKYDTLKAQDKRQSITQEVEDKLNVLLAKAGRARAS